MCGGGMLALLAQREAWSYVVCRQCGHGQLSPIPSADELREFYEASYFEASSSGGYANYVADEPLHRLNSGGRLKRLARAGVSGGKLLDIGCAAGFFLDEARKAGFSVVGQDVSRWARHFARDTLGLEVVSSVDEILPAQRASFRCVTLFQLLEHDPDPRALLHKVHALLQPGGVLVVETWRRDSLIARLFGRYWQQLSPPSVIHLFSQKSALALAAETGFTDIKLQSSSKTVSAPFVGNLLAKKHPFLFTPLAWLTSRWPMKYVSAPYALGDLVTMTARKLP
ncbi:Methyltransferase type 11 [Pirellula staleyi DSM 6068]|uniref:Methyltransferase type 11 n=1 Tax=Pirellula staleyi (strain ATCC 27377 / DSM 6068 / ICPB 4128) TaxID=530564 RepID=D2QXL3_PIRSD|nr:Methyltransferase type 11 [Pirellula staleyi DSM 6068]